MDRVVLHPRRRPGYLGRLHSMQLLVVEVAVLGALAGFAVGSLEGTVAALAALAVAVLTLTRWRGRWLLERRLLVSRYRRRKKQARAIGPATSVLSVLRRLAPDLDVENVPIQGGAQVGVARDDAGWFAAAAVAPGVISAGSIRVPLDLLAASVADADQAGAVVQVVTQAVPPGSAAPANPAEHSYHQLLSMLGTATLPADHTTWVVVRIDAKGLAEAIGDHNADVSDAPVVTASLLRRLTTSLRQAGVSTTMLDADALVAFLGRACDPFPAPVADQGAFQEKWSAWRSSQLAHRTFWIRDWPPVRQAPAMFDAILAVPTAATTVSFVLDPDHRTGLVDLTALVRVSSTPADLSRACKAVQRTARTANADLFPLDGEQGPAAYATAPTGGGAR